MGKEQGSMEQNQIRLLGPDEIECRIGTISEKGLSLLLYKDARADMKILDEVFGVTGWQRKHEVIGGNLYCMVSIWDEEKKQWVSKMDVGTESYAEKEKGQASDSFKRACVSIGIGRELYTAPFIWIPASKVNIQKKGDKLFTYDKFSVRDISYNAKREISGISILNQEGREVYALMDKNIMQQDKSAIQQDKSRMQQNKSAMRQDKGMLHQNESVMQQDEGVAQTDLQKTNQRPEEGRIETIHRELERTGVVLDAVLERYGVISIPEMTDTMYRKAVSGLKRTKSKAA